MFIGLSHFFHLTSILESIWQIMSELHCFFIGSFLVGYLIFRF